MTISPALNLSLFYTLAWSYFACVNVAFFLNIDVPESNGALGLKYSTPANIVLTST